jgi:hypothetical protein
MSLSYVLATVVVELSYLMRPSWLEFKAIKAIIEY